MNYLSKVKKNKLTQFIMLLQGEPGCGKSTMAGQIPDTLYLGIESVGILLDNIIDKENFRTYSDLLSILEEIREDKNFSYKSIVIDSATAVNRLMENHILDLYTINGKRPVSITDDNNKSLNFGAGNVIMDTLWNSFMDLLIDIRNIHNVRITLVAHQVRVQIANGLEEQPITKEVADVNKKCLNKILASCDLVCALEKTYVLKNYGKEVRGVQKKVAKEELVVLRMNSQYIQGKARDIFLDKSIIDKNIATIDGEEYDISEFPLPNKDSMYEDFEKLINPILRLTGNSFFEKTSPVEVEKKKEKLVKSPKKKRSIAEELEDEVEAETK